ncbi:MAG: magnesium transporter CorA family protein [Chloroflexota bacterium]
MATNKLKHERTIWIDIVQPTPEDIEILSGAYPYIHPLNLEDLLSPIERPKLDIDDSYLFVVLHFPVWDAQQRLTRSREVDLILGRGYVISIHDGSLKPLTTLFHMCEQNAIFHDELLGGGAPHTFYVIIDRLVDYVLPILRKVDANIRDIEENIFTSDPREIIRNITLVRRDIISLRRIIRQQVPVVERLEQTNHPILHEELEEYFGDIVDHIYRARDIIDENAEVIASLAETADTLASHRINEVMRILTVISVIMLPLTLVSSVYGMNVNLPLDANPNAFIIISGVMVVMAAAMLVYFRRRNWL